jgi:hypothetical protein
MSRAYDGDIQMIECSSIRVHQHAANTQKRRSIPLHGSRTEDRRRVNASTRCPLRLESDSQALRRSVRRWATTGLNAPQQKAGRHPF